jgi:hypothetical protein
MANKEIASDLLRVDSMKESDIDFTDNPPTSNDFWRNAQVMHKGKPIARDSSHLTPASELEKEVWKVLEESRHVTKKIISREREGELVSQDLLNAQLRTCRKR